MAPSLLLTKMPMSPSRVMGMVLCVAIICIIFSAIRAPPKTLKLGAVFEQPDTAPADAHIKRDTSGRTMAEPRFWQTFNFQSEKIPSSVTEAAPNVNVSSNNVNIMGVNTFYREAQPPKGVEASGEVVVLLHGAAFKSETWLNLNTINLLAAMGHRVIAIDLPGFGNTRSGKVDKTSLYLHTILEQLNAKKPILVSPSMSGSFSLPLLIEYRDTLGGFVPVAPVETNKWKAFYPDLQVPTLIIYGQKDTRIGITSRDDLSNIPTSQSVMLPDAMHPAYIDQPEIFHTLLYNFIKQVHAHRAVV